MIQSGFRALSGALMAAEAVGDTKRYKAQQQQARTKRINGPHAPGGAPPMRKVSAQEGLNFYLKKQAAPRQAFAPQVGDLGKALMWGAGLAAGGSAIRGGAQGVSSMYQKFAAKRMFDELKRRYPEIRRNEKKAKEAFDLAIAYAPSLMRHPAAIGDFVRRQMEFPMSSHEYLKSLADLEATVSKTEASSAPAQLGSDAARGGQSLLIPFSAGV